MSDFTFGLYDDLDIVIDGRVEITDAEPGCPAPACSNPSSPKFSDPGIGLNYNISKIILVINNTEIEIDEETFEKICQALDVRIANKIKEKFKEIGGGRK